MNGNDTIIPNFVSVSGLQRGYPGLLKQLKRSRKPLLILKNNSLEAVMLSPEVDKMLQDKIAEYELKDTLEAIKVFNEEEKSGKLRVARKASDIIMDEN